MTVRDACHTEGEWERRVIKHDTVLTQVNLGQGFMMSMNHFFNLSLAIF